jgi:hypothetical protein
MGTRSSAIGAAGGAWFDDASRIAHTTGMIEKPRMNVTTTRPGIRLRALVGRRCARRSAGCGPQVNTR